MPHSILRRVAFACVFLLASAARAASPIVLPGTTFDGEAQIKAKLPDLGSTAGPVDIVLNFGPQATPALGAGEFLIVADDSVETLEIHGTFSVDDKGQPLLAVDTNLLAADLKELMIHVCVDILLIDPVDCAAIEDLDVLFDVTRLKLKARTNQEAGEITFSAKIPFILSNGIDEAKVTVSLKTSPPVTLVP